MYVEKFITQLKLLKQGNTGMQTCAKELQTQISYFDKRVADIYHKIENTAYTHVSQSHNDMKQLQALLTGRRRVKRMHKLNPILIKMQELVHSMNEILAATDKFCPTSTQYVILKKDDYEKQQSSDSRVSNSVHIAQDL